MDKKQAKPYWDMFVKTLKVVGDILKPVGKALKSVGKFLLDHADACSKLLPVLLGVGVGFKAFKKIPAWMSPFKKAKDTFDDTGKSSGNAKNAMENLKNSVASLAKNAGIALIIASLAMLAKYMQEIGSLGSSAVAPLTTFGLVVAGLMGTFALLGDRLEKSAVGMVAFYATIASIWHLPFETEVPATILAIDTLLGAVLKISTNKYNKGLDEDITC